MKKSFRILFIIGSVMMLCGVITAGLTYRDMRAQRLLHEPLRIFKFDLSRQSTWQSAPLPIYQNGQHIIFLSSSATNRHTPADESPGTKDESFTGRVEIVVENSSGEVISRGATHSPAPAWERPDGLIWFELDTLEVSGISPGNWNISARVAQADPRYARKLAELIVIPPHPEAFTPYLEHESYKLFVSGMLLVCGFLVVIFGGRLSPGTNK